MTVREPEAPEIAVESVMDEPIERRARPLVRAVASIGCLAVAAAGTWMLSRPAEPSLAIFDRPPTAEEEAKATEVQSIGFLGAEGSVDARLILEAPSRRSETGQRVWAYSGETDLYGVGVTERFICLALEGAASAEGTILACMETDVVARRGFVPVDAPRPFLFVDGERRDIEWGPTGPARLVDPPAPSSTPTSARPSGAGGSEGG